MGGAQGRARSAQSAQRRVRRPGRAGRGGGRPAGGPGRRAPAAARALGEAPFEAPSGAEGQGMQPECVGAGGGGAAGSPGLTGAGAPRLKAQIDAFVASNKVVTFLKGSKVQPKCGFSATVVGILRRLEVEEWESMDILEFPELRTAMKVYSNWPTFPQVYIDGEFYGGCDILTEAFESGELQEHLEVLRNQ